jgi:hypothetical protein
MIYDEVHSFARDYINDKSFRTYTRKAKIREAYELLTGEKIKISCSTCYIEALLTIINNTKMASSKYELKKGVLLQAFGDASKTCTNDTLTDELGDWYMKNYPEKIIYFSRVPSVTRQVIPPSITIIQPKERVVEPTVDKLAEKLTSGVTEEKKERKTPVKSKAKK